MTVEAVTFYTVTDSLTRSVLLVFFWVARGEVNSSCFWQKLADIEGGTRKQLFSLVCALVKQEEWKRAEHSNLLLCFKCGMETQRFESVRDDLKASISGSVLENRGKIICCLCSVLCLCLPACFLYLP